MLSLNIVLLILLYQIYIIITPFNIVVPLDIGVRGIPIATIRACALVQTPTVCKFPADNLEMTVKYSREIEVARWLLHPGFASELRRGAALDLEGSAAAKRHQAEDSSARRSRSSSRRASPSPVSSSPPTSKLPPQQPDDEEDVDEFEGMTMRRTSTSSTASTRRASTTAAWCVPCFITVKWDSIFGCVADASLIILLYL